MAFNFLIKGIFGKGRSLIYSEKRERRLNLVISNIHEDYILTLKKHPMDPRMKAILDNSPRCKALPLTPQGSIAKKVEEPIADGSENILQFIQRD